MAAIDTLLRALLRHDMDTLVLVPGERPGLQQGDRQHPVTRTTLDTDTLIQLLTEISPAGSEPRPGGEFGFDYALGGTTFRFLGGDFADGWSVRAAAVGEPAPAEEPNPAMASATGTAPLPPAGGTPERPLPETPFPEVSVPEPTAIPEPPTADPSAVAEAPETETATAVAELRAETATAISERPPAEPRPDELPQVEPPSAESAAAEPAKPAGRPIASVVELLDVLVDGGASDLHLCVGEHPRIRLDGELEELATFDPPSADLLERLLREITPERQQAEFDETNDADFAHEYPGRARFRVNLFRNRTGVAAVLRQIPHEIPTFEKLGLPEHLRRLTELSKGLVLVTGPTGSGKSTTLAALIDLVNKTRRDHVITIEDPIEFVHPSRGCLVSQREVGVHTRSFKRALRAALREDPDIVLVGEMRDLETTAIAIETAETGHLVFGTLHTTTAPSTVERIVDQFPGDRQEQIRIMLSESLRAVISQNLLKRVGGGRVAAFEILMATPAVSNLIREGKTFQIPSALQTGKAQGMCQMTDSLLALVEQKVVEPREAYLKASDKEALLSKYRAAGIPFEPATPKRTGG